MSCDTQIVCPDDIRKRIGENVSDQSVNAAAWDIAEKETKTFLSLKKNVILDATNVNAYEWQNFVSRLPECQKVAKLFEVDPGVAYRRIEMDIMHEKDRCHVPEHAVYRYYGMYLFTKKELEEERDDFEVTVLDGDPGEWTLDIEESQQRFGGHYKQEV